MVLNEVYGSGVYGTYVPIIPFIVIGILIPGGAMLVSKFLRPERYYAEKLSTFECGEIPVGSAQTQFDIQYYVFAIIFVVFDVEILFLYPWALVFPDIGILAVAEAILFIVMLLIPWVYAWKKGLLEWMPMD